MDSEYCLRWKKYETNFRTFFSDLYQNDTLVDVSLVSQEGNVISAHRVVLAACSPYFQSIFKKIPSNYPHPVVVLKDVMMEDLQAILCFMYKGYVNVSQSRVNGIIAIASSLQVKGLSTGSANPYDQSTTVVNSLKPLPTLTSDKTNYTRTLPNLRPSPDSLRISQKRKIEGQSPLSHENEYSGGEKEPDHYGKLPPLHSQPQHLKFSGCTVTEKSPQNVDVKLESMDAFQPKIENRMDDTDFLDATRDEQGGISGGNHGFLPGTKTLDALNDNLSDVDFVDDSDYSEALEFVQQDVPFLGEPSTPTGHHFMTAANSGSDLKPVVKKKGSSSETRRFKCNTCGNFYAKRSGLTRHIRSSHAGMNSFLCNICNKNYTRSDILVKHKRRVHNLECQPELNKISSTEESKSAQCNQYNKYSHLNRHLQTHSDPRFQCDKCLKLFVRKDVLRRHLIEVHNVVVQNCKIK